MFVTAAACVFLEAAIFWNVAIIAKMETPD